MITRRLHTIGLQAALMAFWGLAVVGCKSHHVQIAVENRTGVPLQLLEVDYPSASFGQDSLAMGATFLYRVQVRGSGPVKVQYSVSGGVHRQIAGPQLSEGDQGSLTIVLLPDGKAEFSSQISHGR
jgi:hypothetical protein